MTYQGGYYSHTLLHVAAEGGNVEIVECLLQQPGVNVGVRKRERPLSINY